MVVASVDGRKKSWELTYLRANGSLHQNLNPIPLSLIYPTATATFFALSPPILHLPLSYVMEFNLPRVKVVVTAKNENNVLLSTWIVTFFLRSNCKDCTAVQRLFRERCLRFVEININVYMEKEKELVDQTGCKRMPKIFDARGFVRAVVQI
ncbi:hypothetical protein PIB30_052479 [Stylosanthes scabra]|uniref:Glutaredoxin domain-containing protein n=1 Tax=Stylosanthes scabra TaxID=79078 RepID=A0ABU6RIE0_9FABA|nr:hypothetical protein [Stylosanthes scabra]